MDYYKPKYALELKSFSEMDYYVVREYALPVELMMENAGLQLARLASRIANQNMKILIGVGNGNNGGGGLVAARRLAAWGYQVFLDLPVAISKTLPSKQLERALKFGVQKKSIANPDIWIDAYLGFSQRLPLSKEFLRSIDLANQSKAIRIALDLPTGISNIAGSPNFHADYVMTLAAYKKILNNLPSKTKLFLADLGIPEEVYTKFGIEQPPFQKSGLIELVIS